jgi:hypothetical protein
VLFAGADGEICVRSLENRLTLNLSDNFWPSLEPLIPLGRGFDPSLGRERNKHLGSSTEKGLFVLKDSSGRSAKGIFFDGASGACGVDCQ